MHEPGASPVGGVRSRRVVSTPNCITITSTRRCGDLERKEARIFQEHISCSVVISIDDERTARTAKHLGATECRVEVCVHGACRSWRCTPRPRPPPCNDRLTER